MIASRARIARVSILALVVGACAWFVLGIRQASEIARATSIISRSNALTVTQSTQAASLLASAGLLNPDAEVDLLRGRLELRENNPARARQIFLDVVRREPMNLKAWLSVLQVAHGEGPIAGTAVKHMVRLDPPVRPAP